MDQRKQLQVEQKTESKSTSTTQGSSQENNQELLNYISTIINHFNGAPEGKQSTSDIPSDVMDEMVTDASHQILDNHKKLITKLNVFSSSLISVEIKNEFLKQAKQALNSFNKITIDERETKEFREEAIAVDKLYDETQKSEFEVLALNALPLGYA